MTREQAQQNLDRLQAQFDEQEKMSGHPSHYYDKGTLNKRRRLNNKGKAFVEGQRLLLKEIAAAKKYIADNTARWNNEDRQKQFEELGPVDSSNIYGQIDRLQMDPGVRAIMDEHGIAPYKPPTILNPDGTLKEGYGKEERDAGVWSEARRLQQQDLNRQAGKSMSDANRLTANQMQNVAMRGGLRTGARGRIAQTGLRAGLAAQQETLGKRLGLDIADEAARQKDLEFNIGQRGGAFDKASEQYDDFYKTLRDAQVGKTASDEIK